jgi:hypothetical protein
MAGVSSTIPALTQKVLDEGREPQAQGPTTKGCSLCGTRQRAQDPSTRRDPTTGDCQDSRACEARQGGEPHD